MIKKYFLFASCLFLGLSSLFAQDEQLSNKLMTNFKALNQPQQRNLKADNIHNHLQLTHVLNEAIVNWDQLTTPAQQLFGQYRGNKPYMPVDSIYIVENFRIHYCYKSSDKYINVDSTDADTSGVPDYVEKIAEKLKQVSKRYHEDLGFMTPPSGAGSKNDTLYDVYINTYYTGMSTYGCVNLDQNLGDNPRSTEVERYSYSSYMVLNSNISGLTDADSNLSITIAHEYMHAIQNGYSAKMLESFMEMTATWGESYCFPNIDFNIKYISSLLAVTDKPLIFDNKEVSMERGLNSSYYNGTFLFPTYIAEHLSDKIIKLVYRRIAGIEYQSFQALQITMNMIDAEFKAAGSSFSNVYRDFCVSNFIMTSDSALMPYTYSNANKYNKQLKLDNFLFNVEDTLNYTGVADTFQSNIDGDSKLMRVSADYIAINAKDTFGIKLSCPGNKFVDMVLIKIDSADSSYHIINSYSDSTSNRWISFKNGMTNDSTPKDTITVDTTAHDTIAVNDTTIKDTIAANDTTVNDTTAQDTTQVKTRAGKLNAFSYMLVVYRTDISCFDTTSAQYTLTIDKNAPLSIFHKVPKRIDIKIYPNPASNSLNISTTSSKDTYIILNLMGQVIHKGNCNDNSTTIDVSGYSNGLYFLKILGSNKSISLNKFLVKH